MHYKESNMRKGIAPYLEKYPISCKMYNRAMKGGGGTPPKSKAIMYMGDLLTWVCDTRYPYMHGDGRRVMVLQTLLPSNPVCSEELAQPSAADQGVAATEVPVQYLTLTQRNIN
jgi:hypothetical protein